MTVHDSSEIVPARLRDRDQWVCWRETERDGAVTKVPIDPTTGGFASTTDPETWASFEAALDASNSVDFDGIGFVFTPDDDFVGVDLDDCWNPDEASFSDDASDIVRRLDSYTERSPSGTGCHVIVEGALPEGGNRRGTVEMYDEARFFTVTGEHLDTAPTTIAYRPDALRAVHEEYVLDLPEDAPSDEEATTAPEPTEPVAGTRLTDDALLEKASNARNGEKFDRLWSGDTSGYESHSEADMALCLLLAFWTGGDTAQIDRLFRRSGLMRAKWDEVHYADRATYGERTVERAVTNVSAYYDPSQRAYDEESADDTG